MNQKRFVSIVLVIAVITLVGAGIYSALIQKPEAPPATQTPPPAQTPPPTGDSVENWLTYEWGALKFKYPADWQVEKDYYSSAAQQAAGEPAQEVGLMIFPGEEIQSDNYIGVAGRQMSCYNPSITKCVSVGFGSDSYPIYTLGNDSETLKVFDSIIQSIKDFGWTIYLFDHGQYIQSQ